MRHGFPKLASFSTLNKLSREFQNSEIYLVGGSVRDILSRVRGNPLGKTITDIDILVRNISADELESFLADHGKVVFAGKRFGIWKFKEHSKPLGETYDIALPRTEFSLHKAGMYRDFSITTDPKLPAEVDLSRRDFTINAMAYDLKNELLIDPHHGKADLKEKLIRTVGKPKARFQEDYSRMLRAIRFSLQLDFEIEKKTKKAIKRKIKHINDEVENKRVVPQEVIAEELIKSFIANPAVALEAWYELGAIKQIIPELLKMRKCKQPKEYHSEGTVWEHTRLALETLASKKFIKEFSEEPVDAELVFSVLFHDIGKPIAKKKVNGKLRYDSHDEIGARITKKILNRLRATAPPDVGINAEQVIWMVRKHMLLVHADVDAMKPTTIEKYFFSTKLPSRNFLKLLYIDGQASLNSKGKPFTGKYKHIIKRMAEIKKKTKSKGIDLAKPLITGHDVMKQLKLKPGKEIGKILDQIRELQLGGTLTTKKQAIIHLKEL
jgi:tRNA nucleotidyltransferase/poly(A) polymerase